MTIVNYEIPDNPHGIRPLLIDDMIPQITALDIRGNDFDVNQAASQQPTILMFFRGNW